MADPFIFCCARQDMGGRKKGLQSMKHKAIISLLMAGVLSIFSFSIISSAAESGPMQTVILGTYAWDFEKNAFSKDENSDFLWDHDYNEQALRAVNGAAMAVMPVRSFGRIDLDYAGKQEFSKKDLTMTAVRNQVVPGMVLVFRTAEGHYGKMEIIGFRSSHDFNFPEAANLSQKVKDYLAKQQPVKEKYHLEVKWMLLQ